MRIDTETQARDRSPDKFRDTELLKGLLVGENVQSYSYVAKRLQQRGCKCEFATSYEEVCSLLGAQDICLVLSTTRLRGRDLLPLIDLLGGSKVTLFYTHSVEVGCWWLPALWRGNLCFGSYAIPPSLFVFALDELVNGIRFDEDMNERRQELIVSLVKHREKYGGR